MESGVIGVSVGNEGEFGAGFGFVGIKPKTQFRQQDAAAMKPDA
jgi:hypothetical protein